MRKNITAVILFAAILCAFGGILLRCGRGEEAEKKDGGEAEILKEEESCETEPDGTSVEMDFPALQEELRPSILQIYCGDYRGSGVVWEITEENVTVVSSGHLLKNGETCEVLCCAGVYYEAKVDRILEDCDIGFAVFPAKALKEDGVELSAAVVSERGKEELVQGEELIVYGSMEDVAGDFVRGYLIEAESEIQFEGDGSAQALMLGGIVRERGTEADMQANGGKDGAESGKADILESEDGTETGENGMDSTVSEPGPVDAGMSGSGVFDRQGKLLGILAGGDGESGFAAVPVWEIEE